MVEAQPQPGAYRERIAEPVARTFDEYKEYFHNLVGEAGPEAAVEALAEEMDRSEVVFEYCHALAHEVGHAAYEEYGFQEALLFEEDLCGSAYLHGVVEYYLADQTDMLAAMRTVCESGDGVCLHGVGHGLMIYTNNDVPAALAYCDEFTDHADQVHCSEGVFMENVGLDLDLHAHPYLKPEDPFYPCNEQEGAYASTCYFYAPRFYNRLHEGAYEEAIEWCTTADFAYITDCMRGVGSTMMKYSMNEVSRIDGVCMTAPNEYVPYCIRGLTSYYIVNYASASKGQDLCEAFQESNKEACMAEVEAKSPFYRD